MTIFKPAAPNSCLNKTKYKQHLVARKIMVMTVRLQPSILAEKLKQIRETLDLS
jgi:hypothetical protein